MHDPDTPQLAPKSDGHFSIDFVNRIVAYLSMLVVMGIDKCSLVHWYLPMPHHSYVPTSLNNTPMRLSQ